MREMRELRKKYDCVKSKYKTLKASCVFTCLHMRAYTYPILTLVDKRTPPLRRRNPR